MDDWLASQVPPEKGVAGGFNHMSSKFRHDQLDFENFQYVFDITMHTKYATGLKFFHKRVVFHKIFNSFVHLQFLYKHE